MKYESSFFEGWHLKDDNISKWDHVNSVLIYGEEKKEIPLVSVCIPTYKGRASFLKEAIDSVLAQKDFTSYEIIVSDNYVIGDLENDALMKEYCSKYDNIYYYRTDFDFGMVANWNRSIKLGRAKWVVSLHNDDVMLPNYLKTVYEFAKKNNPTLVGVFRNIITSNNTVNNKYVNGLSKAQLILSKLRNGRAFKVCLNDIPRQILPATGCLLYDREKFIEFGGYHERFEEPTDGFCHFNQIYNGKVYIIPKVLYSRRIADNTISSVSLKVAEMLYCFNNFCIKTDMVKTSKFKFDVSTAYNVYGIKSKYNPDMDCKKLLIDLGVSPKVASLPPKVLTLLNCFMLVDLIFRN